MYSRWEQFALIVFIYWQTVLSYEEESNNRFNGGRDWWPLVVVIHSIWIKTAIFAGKVAMIYLDPDEGLVFTPPPHSTLSKWSNFKTNADVLLLIISIRYELPITLDIAFGLLLSVIGVFDYYYDIVIRQRTKCYNTRGWIGSILRSVQTGMNAYSASRPYHVTVESRDLLFVMNIILASAWYWTTDRIMEDIHCCHFNLYMYQHEKELNSHCIKEIVQDRKDLNWKIERNLHREKYQSLHTCDLVPKLWIMFAIITRTCAFLSAAHQIMLQLFALWMLYRLAKIKEDKCVESISLRISLMSSTL